MGIVMAKQSGEKSVKQSLNIGANKLAVLMDVGLVGNVREKGRKESRLLGRPTRLLE